MKEGRDTNARRMAQTALERIQGIRTDGAPPLTHTHSVSDVLGLQAQIDGKQPVGSYSLTSHNHSGVYALVAHTHAIADVTGLQAALDGKQAAGSYAAAVHTHVIADVTGLQTALDGKQAAGSYAAASHTHTIANVTGLQTALDGKQAAGSYAAAVHTHIIADVTGLQTALDGKQPSGSYSLTSHDHSGVYAPISHTHAMSDVTGLTAALAGKSDTGHTHSYLPLSGGTLSGGLAVTGNITATLKVFAAGGVAANSGNSASTSAINPGLTMFDDGSNRYGTELGHNPSIGYSMRVYCAATQALEFGGYTAGSTSQSGFTAWAWMNSTEFNLTSGRVLKVNGTKVVGAQQAAIANHASDATVNSILAALRAHGLIAT